MEQWLNDILQGKTKVLGEKRVPVPLFSIINPISTGLE
jgi:hypothetical protein